MWVAASRIGAADAQSEPQSTTTRPCAARASPSSARSASGSTGVARLGAAAIRRSPGASSLKVCSGASPAAARRASAGSECGVAQPGEHGEAGAVGVGLGDEDGGVAFAGGLAGEAERERGGAGAADEPADGDQRAAGGVEREPARRALVGRRGGGRAGCGRLGQRRPCAHLPAVSAAGEQRAVDAVVLAAEVGVPGGVGLLARDDDRRTLARGRRAGRRAMTLPRELGRSRARLASAALACALARSSAASRPAARRASARWLGGERAPVPVDPRRARTPGPPPARHRPAFPVRPGGRVHVVPDAPHRREPALPSATSRRALVRAGRGPGSRRARARARRDDREPCGARLVHEPGEPGAHSAATVAPR